MSIYTPYTYLVGWSKHQKYYYGVRYSTKSNNLYESGCHPDDFWVTYFTSSPSVKKMRDEYGEPDIIQIRKTFLTKQAAQNWEDKVLKRMDVVSNDKWLNRNVAGTPPDIRNLPGVAEKISKTIKAMGVVPYCENTHSSEAIAKRKAKMNGRKWYHNPNTGEATISHICPDGWLPGKIIKKNPPPLKIRGIDYECHTYSWKVIDPFGNEYDVFNLKKWCEERKVSYLTVYGSSKGWKSMQK